MRILLIGKTGQVGSALAPLLPSLGELVAAGREACDLSDADSIRSLVRSVRPDIVVNAAAYANVNGAENERALAMAINADAPRILAEEVRQRNALLVHYSTDYVFDGAKPGPYLETDAPHPVNAYGESKLKGERRIQASGARHIILRTSWVYGPTGNNFVRTMLRLAADREELTIVDDQMGAPTSSLQVASGTVAVLRAWLAAGNDPEQCGVFHMTAAGEVSWYGFACTFLDQMRHELALKARRIRPVRTTEYPAPAPRPLNSRLCNDKLDAAFGVRLGSWQSGLQEVLAQIRKSEAARLAS